MAKKKKGVCVKYLKGGNHTCFWYETEKERSAAVSLGEKEANRHSPALVYDCVKGGKCHLLSTFQAGAGAKMLGALLGVGLGLGAAMFLTKLGR